MDVFLAQAVSVLSGFRKKKVVDSDEEGRSCDGKPSACKVTASVTQGSLGGSTYILLGYYCCAKLSTRAALP